MNSSPDNSPRGVFILGAGLNDGSVCILSILPEGISVLTSSKMDIPHQSSLHSADSPPRSSTCTCMLSQFTVADVSTLEDGDEDGECPISTALDVTVVEGYNNGPYGMANSQCKVYPA